MTTSIEPADFMRVMALSATDRLDLLEYLGSALADRCGTSELVRSALNCHFAAPPAEPPQRSAAR